MAKKKAQAETASGLSEYEISLEQVQKLCGGDRVNIHGEDENGNHRVLKCTVAMKWDASGNCHRFLTYRHEGEVRRCAIREYPGKYYTKAV